MKRTVTTYLMFVFVWVSCLGCKDQQGQPIDPSAIRDSKIAQILDSSLSLEQSNLLIQDLNFLNQLHFEVPADSEFAKAFGGTNSAEARRYFDQQIHFVVGPTRFEESAHNSKMTTVAANLSALLWEQAKSVYPNDFSILLGNQTVVIDSGEAGVLQLGSAYNAKENPSFVYRLSVLMHEAKHTDGALHVRCPKDHFYAGEFVCDEGAGGANYFQALFAGAIARYCENCSRADKKAALNIERDSLKRIF